MQGIGLYDNDNNFLAIKKDKDLVIENVKRVLLTLPGENVGNLEFGCRIREYLFDFENYLIEDLEQVIISALTRWEPRVKILGVNIKVDEEQKEKIHVTLDLVLTETYEKFSAQIPITL